MKILQNSLGRIENILPIFSLRKDIKKVKKTLANSQFTSPIYLFENIQKEINYQIYINSKLFLFVFNVAIPGKDIQRYTLLIKKSDLYDFYVLKIHWNVKEPTYLINVLNRLNSFLTQEFKRFRLIFVVKNDDKDFFSVLNNYVLEKMISRDKTLEQFVRFNYNQKVYVYVINSG